MTSVFILGEGVAGIYPTHQLCELRFKATVFKNHPTHFHSITKALKLLRLSIMNQAQDYSKSD